MAQPHALLAPSTFSADGSAAHVCSLRLICSAAGFPVLVHGAYFPALHVQARHLFPEYSPASFNKLLSTKCAASLKPRSACTVPVGGTVSLAQSPCCLSLRCLPLNEEGSPQTECFPVHALRLPTALSWSTAARGGVACMAPDKSRVHLELGRSSLSPPSEVQAAGQAFTSASSAASSGHPLSPEQGHEVASPLG